jgi:hypothetical protein
MSSMMTSTRKRVAPWSSNRPSEIYLQVFAKKGARLVLAALIIVASRRLLIP